MTLQWSNRKREVLLSGRRERGYPACTGHGVSAQVGDVCQWGCLPQCMLGYASPLWTEWLTDRCKNITLPELRLRTVTSNKHNPRINVSLDITRTLLIYLALKLQSEERSYIFYMKCHTDTSCSFFLPNQVIRERKKNGYVALNFLLMRKSCLF